MSGEEEADASLRAKFENSVEKWDEDEDAEVEKLVAESPDKSKMMLEATAAID